MQRISISQVETSESFYQVPKALFEQSQYKDLSLEAKILYSIMKDRHKLSRKNNWIDEQGFVYIIFTNREAGKILGCSESKAKSIRKELIKAKLIEIVSPKSKTIKRASHIYIGNLTINPKEIYQEKEPKENKKDNTENENSEDHKLSKSKTIKKDNEQSDLTTKTSPVVSEKVTNTTDKNLTFLEDFYHRENGKTLTPAQKNIIKKWITIYEFEVIIEAISESAKHGSSNLKYIEKTIITKTNELEKAIAELNRSSLNYQKHDNENQLNNVRRNYGF